MPIDDSIQNRNFEELFQNPINFEIPFFQRAYSWDKQQWKQLFDDIEEQIIIDFNSDEASSERTLKDLLDKHLLDHEHYFGAIVVLEKANSNPILKNFVVIDGQQRITTIYLLIGVIVQILREKKDLSQNAQLYIGNLEKFLKNNIDPKGDDYKKLKVYSNKGDRLPTYLKLFNNNNPESPSLAIDIQLYIKEENQIEGFWRYAYRKLKNHDVTSIYVISQAILKSLKIVWIPLDEKKDNPQAIFEGLNDKGMPLSAVELLCSYLFKPLIDEITKQHEKIHNDFWLRSIIKVGGEHEFEFYLRNLFSIDKPKMIGKGRKLYSHFKNNNKNISKQSAFEIINDISNHVDTFNQINYPHDINNSHSNPEISNLLTKIERTSMFSSIPFILALLIELKKENISEKDVILILNSLLILLVRRKVCILSTQKYDVFFPSLLNKIIDEPNKVKAFMDQVKKEDLFVSDQEFLEAFINKTLYKQTELDFARFILQEIDKSLQVFGQLPDYSTINTIEHILPQELNEEWTLYLGDEVSDMNLERIKNTIGNLCLISKPANSSAGRNPFEKKKNGYTDVSSLTKDIKSRTVKWNIENIKIRSEFLGKKALEIWNWKK